MSYPRGTGEGYSKARGTAHAKVLGHVARTQRQASK